MNEATAAVLEELVEQSGATTKSEVVRQALRLYKLILEAKGQKITIAFRDGLFLVAE